MTKPTREQIDGATGELNTPYHVDQSFNNDDGVEVAVICDVNGFHVFDCFESDADEIIKRINGYEQQSETIERLRDNLMNAHMTGQSITGDTPSVHLAVDWVNKLEAGDL